MSRRNKSVKRPVPPDPRYDSQTVSKFVNNLMFEGKKSLAERTFYMALDQIAEKSQEEPLGWAVRLTNGEQLSVSRRQLTAVRDALGSQGH